VVRLSADRLSLATAIRDRAEALDALWAAAHLSWWTADQGRTVDAGPALDVIIPVLHAVAVG
jgi:hypothetical protein